MSQLVIPSSKRSDSAIYTIKAKNSVGEASFDVEVRVTGKEKISALRFCSKISSTGTTGGFFFSLQNIIFINTALHALGNTNLCISKLSLEHFDSYMQ